MRLRRGPHSGLKGDLGTSFLNYPKKVVDIIKSAVPWTIALQLPSIVLAWFVGNILGALAAYRRGVFDKLFFPFALGLNSIPFFAFGMLLVYMFGIYWQVFPAIGGYDGGLIPSFSWVFLVSAAYHYLLPFLSIFLILAGGQAIGMRSMCIYELGTDYVKYAKWLGHFRNQGAFLHVSQCHAAAVDRFGAVAGHDDRRGSHNGNDFFVSGPRHGRAVGNSG